MSSKLCIFAENTNYFTRPATLGSLFQTLQARKREVCSSKNWCTQKKWGSKAHRGSKELTGADKVPTRAHWGSLGYTMAYLNSAQKWGHWANWALLGLTGLTGDYRGSLGIAGLTVAQKGSPRITMAHFNSVQKLTHWANRGSLGTTRVSRD